MTTYMDKAGRRHICELTVGSARKVKSAVNVNLIDPLELINGKTSLEVLSGNVEAIVDTLFILSGESDPEAFAECFDGDTIERAVEALIAEIINFSRPPMRTLMEKIWGAIKKTKEKATTAAQAISQEAIEKAILNSATALEGSSASTPTR